MLFFTYKDLNIEIATDFTPYSDLAERLHYEQATFYGENSETIPSTLNEVRVKRDDDLLSMCIVAGYQGAKGIHDSSFLTDDDHLLLCCSNQLFCLSLPELKLKWKTEADPVTCFRIFRLEDDYLIHGEMQLCRITKNGNIKWAFGGSDIFVHLSEEPVLQITDKHIFVFDFTGQKYQLDFDGNLKN